MAKKNKVIVMGFVHEILDTDNEKVMFTLKIRKNPTRFVYPIIVLNENREKFKELIKEKALVAILGEIRTERREEYYECPNPNCSEKIIDRYIFTTVEAEDIKFVKPNEKDPFMNEVLLLGVVCREKDFRYIEGTKSPLGNTKYQVAVNRREPKTTDYPWINSFARQAEEDARRLQVGSQILIDGILNTRKNKKECECSLCTSKIEVTEHLTEVVANTVEYLNNCIFDDK
ncbi:single-stranded DNA-binding protein [Alkaliphilus sp. B6464]|uniref:single-stranded DNA-binding protein n=1 Tax=Alkaliphilus sp. B6464 TaxID=2731219 RepID=UPI001BACF25A|nr:single-stranded DNA-binding protein [Alkaliphilus sp. B6464]QUH22034.1 single-stranded DNA-binding protein [Alkaliphilus sp. B6464]